MPPLAGRGDHGPRQAGARRTWIAPRVLPVIGVVLACVAIVALTPSTAVAAPAGSVAARGRDEDVDLGRLLPLAAVTLGGAGWVAGRRAGRTGTAHRIAVGTALVVTALALWPVVATGSRPLNRQPSPDAQEYADAARNLAEGHGYQITFRGSAQPPRYPPGFSLALAPFALTGKYPANVQVGAKVYALLYVLATARVAWLVGGPLAAAVAAALVGSSPFALRFGSLVMSDAFAAGLTIVCLGLIHRPTRLRLALAGAVSGALVVVRLSALVQVPALLAGLTNRQRVVLGLCVLPGLVALGLHQWSTFGSPLATGYQYWLPEVRNFGLDYPFDPTTKRDGAGIVADSLDGALFAWRCPCDENGPLTTFPSIVFYPLVLLGLFWIFTPPLATLPGLFEVWKRRREPGAAFVLWLTVLSLLFYLVYFYQGARFMAAPATGLAIYSGVAVAGWLTRLSPDRQPTSAPARGAPSEVPVLPS